MAFVRTKQFVVTFLVSNEIASGGQIGMHKMYHSAGYRENRRINSFMSNVSTIGIDRPCEGDAKTENVSITHISDKYHSYWIGNTHCEIGRGSPYIGGKLMLISWTRTAVRIFGGVLLKNVASDCGNF